MLPQQQREGCRLQRTAPSQTAPEGKFLMLSKEYDADVYFICAFNMPNGDFQAAKPVTWVGEVLLTHYRCNSPQLPPCLP